MCKWNESVRKKGLDIILMILFDSNAASNVGCMAFVVDLTRGKMT